MHCALTIANIGLLGGSTLEFQIEQPNYKTAVSNEKYFNGKLNCHAFTSNSVRSDVKHFSVDIKEGKLSVQVPKYDASSSTGYIQCYGSDIALPAHFGVIKGPNGSIDEHNEARLRIRAEYKRDGISRQYADAGSYDNIIYPPQRTHGLGPNNSPIPYAPLSKSVSIESSETIFDAKTGFKIVLKEVQHTLKGVEIDHVITSGDIRSSVFSSLAPFNTYYELSRANYVNCTAEITGQTFDTILTFGNSAATGTVEFKSRSPVHGEWDPVTVDTTGKDVTISCPQLTILNPTELPTIISVVGLGSNKEGANYAVRPTILSISSASGFASFVAFSAVTIAAATLSMF